MKGEDRISSVFAHMGPNALVRYIVIMVYSVYIYIVLNCVYMEFLDWVQIYNIILSG